jgi:chemotaxis protein methyltransferase WspC
VDPLARVESLLAETIGLDASSIGRRALESSVRTAMQSSSVETIDDYVASLARTAELERLIDAVAVPESYFFRDVGSFDYLRRFARDWRGGVLRILSLPCAAGEEPYSIAIALLEAGLAPPQFRIDAVDVRASAIAAAESATYRPNAFRGEEALRVRERWFTPCASGFALAPHLRETVRFRRGNLLDPLLLAGETFDVVFCKNLLIYLHEEARQRALAQLERLLAKDGRLLVAPSEMVWLQANSGYRRAGDAPALALRRHPVGGQAPPPVLPPMRQARAPVAPQEPTLDHIRNLAGSGQLHEASAIAHDFLRTRGPSDELLALLGLLAYARGDEAEGQRLMDRALYLNPQNVEALTFLALARERDGDVEAAARLRGRALRAEAANA